MNLKTSKNILWTPEISYLVGLITTDGSLSSSGRHIIFTNKDTQLLKTFCRILNLPESIIKLQAISGFNQAAGSLSRNHKIQLSNVKLYRWLTSIGLTPNKTHLLGALKIPLPLFPDFLRGWIDGDGCILIYEDNYQTYKHKTYSYNRLYIQLACASKPHLEWIHKIIQNQLNTKGSISLQKRKLGNIWVLRYAKNDSIKIINYIYYAPNLPKLKRKFQKALPYLKKEATP